MATPRKKLNAGTLAVGYPSARDEAVLNAAGNRQDSCVWNYSADGGAVGDISLGRMLPANAVITKVLSEELTAVASATSITLKAGSTSLTGATDFTADAGIQNRALAGSAAGIKLSADSELKITIATTAATAGKIRWYVEYYLATDAVV
jgi:hypothetical protein